MVSPTFTILSTLAGLRRLEAQVQRALIDAGDTTGAADPGQRVEQIQQDAQESMAKIQGTLDRLDIRA